MATLKEVQGLPLLEVLSSASCPHVPVNALLECPS